MQAEASQACLINLSDRYEELKDHTALSSCLLNTDAQTDRAPLGPHVTTESGV